MSGHQKHEHDELCFRWGELDCKRWQMGELEENHKLIGGPDYERDMA